MAAEQSISGGTDVLERTEREVDDGEKDRFAHYVRTDRAAQAAITGRPVVALCGKVWVPSRDAKKYPICPRCKELRDMLANNGSNWPFK